MSGYGIFPKSDVNTVLRFLPLNQIDVEVSVFRSRVCDGKPIPPLGVFVSLCSAL
jgi:hypothetical protein